MNRPERETDARIAIDELLQQSGWNPADKSMVGIEVPVTSSQSCHRTRRPLAGACFPDTRSGL